LISRSTVALEDKSLIFAESKNYVAKIPLKKRAGKDGKPSENCRFKPAKPPKKIKA
jgi:hypothetical protein